MDAVEPDAVVLAAPTETSVAPLHEAIATSGLDFGASARFTFSPHVTLNLYRTLTPERLKMLMAVRIQEPFTLDRFQVYQSRTPQPPRKMLELELAGVRAPA